MGTERRHRRDGCERQGRVAFPAHKKDIAAIDEDDFFIAQAPGNDFLVGKSLREIREIYEMNDSRDALLRLMQAMQLKGIVLYKNLDAALIARAIASKRSLIASNAPSFIDGQPGRKHFKSERTTATFSTFLSLVEEQKIMPFEDAIRKITRDPAKKFGITAEGDNRREFCRSGLFPRREVKFTIVNGRVVEKGKRIQAKFPGKTLRHPADKKNIIASWQRRRDERAPATQIIFYWRRCASCWSSGSRCSHLRRPISENNCSTTVIIISNTSSHSDLGIGIIGFLVGYFVPYYKFKNIAFVLLLVSVVSLILVFTPLGIAASGSTRWLRLGPLSFQPAELMKLTSFCISRRGFRIQRSAPPIFSPGSCRLRSFPVSSARCLFSNRPRARSRFYSAPASLFIL